MAQKVNDEKNAKAKTVKAETPAEDRQALNDRARFDYGIMNAEDMSDAQVKSEIKAIDDQAKVGAKADAEAKKEAEKAQA